MKLEKKKLKNGKLENKLLDSRNEAEKLIKLFP